MPVTDRAPSSTLSASHHRRSAWTFGRIGVARNQTTVIYGNMSLAELEREVLKLSPADLNAFTRWLDEHASRAWDEQLEKDVASGKLDHIAKKADAEFIAGRCTEL